MSQTSVIIMCTHDLTWTHQLMLASSCFHRTMMRELVLVPMEAGQEGVGSVLLLGQEVAAITLLVDTVVILAVNIAMVVAVVVIMTVGVVAMPLIVAHMVVLVVVGMVVAAVAAMAVVLRGVMMAVVGLAAASMGVEEQQGAMGVVVLTWVVVTGVEGIGMVLLLLLLVVMVIAADKVRGTRSNAWLDMGPRAASDASGALCMTDNCVLS